MNILIVDDEPTNRRLLCAILEAEGYSVTEANDGIEAIAALEAGGVDAVISDILMPNMDGYRLCHEIRQSERFHKLPFIAYTATRDSDNDAKVTLELGADVYIHKPAASGAVVAALRQVARSASSRWATRSPVPANILQAHIEHLREKLDEEHTVLASKAKIKHLNAQLRESNKRFREYDRFKSEFLATASHEMRTPLTIVREFASLMADGATGEVNDRQRECLDSILRNCVRLTSLIDDLLDLARIESGTLRLRREKLDIAPLLAECVADFDPQFKAKNQTLLLELKEAPIPPVLGDRAKIEQVMVNLIGNAHKFTPEGGKVVVNTVPEPKSVRVIVSDNGPGIDAAHVDSVFDAFTQIDREEGPGLRGTGLGLTITRRLVQYHDSDITVSSAEEHGTSFAFALPTYDVESEHRAFLIDHARCTTRGMVGTVIAVAPRSLDGSLVRSNLDTIKSRCDLAISKAKSCHSISDDGVFLYFLEAAAPVSRHSVLRLLESVSQADERIFCERDTVRASNPAQSLTRVRARILQELNGGPH